MNYKFTNKCYGWKGHFGVEYESLPEEEKTLHEIAWQGWTSTEVEKIIHNAKALKANQAYDYQVEGSEFYIIVKKAHVNMWKKESKTPDITWNFNKFITFLEEFKSFLIKHQK
jgi:hypothetical protein